MDEIMTITGRHKYTVYHNKENGYTVAKFTTYDENEKVITVTGHFSQLNTNDVYILNGNYVEHKKYGLQFQVNSYDISKKKDRISLIRYFSSPLFPGIGKKIAEQIVEILGEECIDNIKDNPDILLQIPLLSDKKRNVIIDVLHQTENEDDIHTFFSKRGVNIKNIVKFESVYGEDAIHFIKENPYRIIEEVDGIGFKTADKLAQELSFDMDHPYRLKAMVLSTILDLCMKTGDTFLYKEDIEKQVIKQFPTINLVEHLTVLMEQQLIHIEEDRIYHHTQYESEKGIVDFLYEFPIQTQMQISKTALQQEIALLEDSLRIKYDDMQKKAIYTFFEEPFSILSGGPGTGKTTIVQGIIELYKYFYPNQVISCCAPTGRAAKRLAEITGCTSTTIHSLLKWDLENNAFGVNEKEPLEVDVLIIDEFSMVDQWLCYHLLNASTWVKKILVIGDDQQLPSVGCGNVLRDLIHSKVFPVISLSRIFRQKEESQVVKLAHLIREEKIQSFEEGEDLHFLSCNNYEVRDVISEIIEKKLTEGYNSKDIQVLAPMYQGVAGIDILNNTVQNLLNPFEEGKVEVQAGYRIFRTGDKVLQLKNQPEDEVYNGDIGEIIEIQYLDYEHNTFELFVDFDGNIVSYTKDEIFHLTHAFCISIHKAQGSEYPIVILPVVNDYIYMLDRSLLYTGITRARNELIIVGEIDTFLKSTHRRERHQRKTYLKERFIKKFE